MGGPRVPDVIIIGAMKAGTTSLFRWLETHPQCQMPPAKEPHFFSHNYDEDLQLGRYLRLFAGVPTAMVTGEASASYADPRIGDEVARRIARLAPNARLIYLVRDPEARLRSHYLHEWQRSRERRPFLDAVSEPGNGYVALSRYLDCIEQFLGHFDRDQLLVLPTEQLGEADSGGWRRVTDHLRISTHVGGTDRANVTANKVAFSPLVLRLWEAGLLEGARRLPAPVRRLARSTTSRRTNELGRTLEQVRSTPVPRDVAHSLGRQWQGLREWREG